MTARFFSTPPMTGEQIVGVKKNRWRRCLRARLFAEIFVTVAVGSPAFAETSPPPAPAATTAPHSVQKEKDHMTTTTTAKRASGSFEVKLNPLPTADADKGAASAGGDNKDGGAALGRMSIDKQFHGELEATSQGEMLTAMTGTKGSAGYVAIERVTGSLAGRSGAFTLQHTGTMNRGTPELSVTVVPDSGTGQLTGLTGRMTIRIEAGGKHFYDFDYSLADAR